MCLPNELLRLFKVMIVGKEGDKDLIAGIYHSRIVYSGEILEQNADFRYNF